MPTTSAAQTPGTAPAHAPDEAVVRLGCNRTDTSSVFLVRSPAETQELLNRLQKGPLAVRFQDCQVELLPDCAVAGSGKITSDQSCCSTPIGCAGGEGIDCYGNVERYWFGNPREWLFNLPELWRRHPTSSDGAWVVSADVRREYRVDVEGDLKPACSEATHIISRARFGSLRVEGEEVRTSLGAPNRRELVPAASTETLIDVTLLSVSESKRIGKLEHCMNLAGYRATWTPSPFLGERQNSPPARCAVECSSGVFDCKKACLERVPGTCDRELGKRGPEFNGPLDAACTAGFGESCRARSASDIPRLKAICEHGGDRSARVCGELASLLPPDEAIEYAFLACERGRASCDTAAELLARAGRTADSRYATALRFGCASGEVELCCTFGEHDLETAGKKSDGVQVLRDVCARGQQACCRTLKEHGLPVPPRHKQPI